MNFFQEWQSAKCKRNLINSDSTWRKSLKKVVAEISFLRIFDSHNYVISVSVYIFIWIQCNLSFSQYDRYIRYIIPKIIITKNAVFCRRIYRNGRVSDFLAIGFRFGRSLPLFSWRYIATKSMHGIDRGYLE